MADDKFTPKAQQPTTEKEAAESATSKSILSDQQQQDLSIRVKTETTDVMNPIAYNQQLMLARDIQRSGSAPGSFQNEYQIMMAITAGREMGMTHVEALQSLYIVNGALKPWGKAVPKALRRHDYRWKFYDETDKSCTVDVWPASDSKDVITETLTYEQAVKSGYTKDRHGEKVGWREGVNRKKKLRYGVLAMIIDTYLPDVLSQVSDGVGEDAMATMPNDAQDKAQAESEIEQAVKAGVRDIDDSIVDGEIVE